MNQTKCDTLPKLITSTHKLVDPAYLRNNQSKLQHMENQLLPLIRGSVIAPNTKSLVIQRLIYSLDFSTRHFGSACDRGFQGLSNYHQSQKFGHSAIKLQPLQRDTVQLTETDEAIDLPKDDRFYFKKIMRHKGMPILLLVKSFEIDFVRDFDDDVDKKHSKQFNFGTALAIFNNTEDPVAFFTKNLQLLERNSVTIKQKGLQSLPTKLRQLSEEPSQRLISIKNSNGFYKINFPIAQLYVQENQHTQTIDLSPNELYQLINTNFTEIDYLVKQFDMEKYELYQAEMVSLNQILSKRQSMEARQSGQFGSHQSARNSVQVLNEQYERILQSKLGLVIVEEKSNFPDEVWKKKLIKKIVRFEDTLYSVNFVPVQILVREKVSQKIVKIYSPSLKEFSNLLGLNLKKGMEEILMENVKIKNNLAPEAFDLKEFKKGITIELSLEEKDVFQEVVQENMDNGLFQEHIREVEINNKDLQIVIIPCQLETYEQKKCINEKRKASIDELNSLFNFKFCVGFKIV